MLEQQQSQLVNALQELYRRITKCEGWKGDLLEVSSNGHPLTHDILERLDALRLDGHLSPDRFEENPEILQQRLLTDGAVHIKRNISPESDSDEDDTPPRKQASPTKRSLAESVLPTASQFPPTPPVQTPSTLWGDSPGAYSSSDTIIPDTMQLHIQPPLWSQSPQSYEASFDFFPTPTMYDGHVQLQQQPNPCLPMPAWEDEIGNLQYNNLDMHIRARV